MDRRKFIGIGVTAATIPFLPSCKQDHQWLSVMAVPLNLAPFCDKNELFAIGEKYLQMFPKENDKYQLQDLLISSNHFTDKETLLATLEKQKMAEFRQGETVIIKGWVLSKTEARQTALYSLISK